MKRFIKIAFFSFLHSTYKLLQSLNIWKQYRNAFVFLFAFCLFTFAFVVPLNPPNGTWYQQFMPNLNGARIIDIKFTDSLTGYAITNFDSSNTAYILRSTNSGVNWFTSLTDTFAPTAMAFLNSTTGYITRGYVDGNGLLFKTTNGGTNWTVINMPEQGISNDISIINADTILVADAAPGEGGIYRTTNAGASWERIYWTGGLNPEPEKIYMYNRNIGFMVYQTISLYKTTNGGFNWTGLSGGAWTDIYFIDSLTGWKSNGDMKKTTNGGLSWITQTMPNGSNFISNGMAGFTVLNKDTLWGSGGIITNGGTHRRGILYRTTNGGINWLFQIVDTSFGIGLFYNIQFLNKSLGWGFGIKANSTTVFWNIHTTNGGDTNFIVGVKQISNEIPKQFRLYQNYPNPFNPVTVIGYQLSVISKVNIKVYDITGKEIVTLVNQKQNAGTYQVDFSGYSYSSGVYFYKLTAASGKEVFTETKRMILIK